MSRALTPSSARKTRDRPAAEAKDPRFHAVEIHCGSGACAAALKLKAQRFLSRQLPPALPLPECDRARKCTCKYLHHDDRRDDARREADAGIGETAQIQIVENRRRGPGRRQSD
jgi:hypothetical protein